MKKTKNLLSCVFAAGMIVVVILVVLYESDILVSGMLAGAHQSEFLWTTLMELATLGCAFLALRLFKFDRVHRALNEQKRRCPEEMGPPPSVAIVPAVVGRHLIILYIYESDIRLSWYHSGTLSAVCLSE